MRRRTGLWVVLTAAAIAACSSSLDNGVSAGSPAPSGIGNASSFGGSTSSVGAGGSGPITPPEQEETARQEARHHSENKEAALHDISGRAEAARV